MSKKRKTKKVRGFTIDYIRSAAQRYAQDNGMYTCHSITINELCRVITGVDARGNAQALTLLGNFLIKNHVIYSISGSSNTTKLVTGNASNPPTKKKPARKQPDSFTFYSSKEWRALRYIVLKESNGCCSVCGRNPIDHGVVLHVDHKKPRSRYPELELQRTNLQLACEDCNLGKSNRDTIDWTLSRFPFIKIPHIFAEDWINPTGE